MHFFFFFFFFFVIGKGVKGKYSLNVYVRSGNVFFLIRNWACFWTYL